MGEQSRDQQAEYEECAQDEYTCCLLWDVMSMEIPHR